MQALCAMAPGLAALSLPGAARGPEKWAAARESWLSGASSAGGRASRADLDLGFYGNDEDAP